MQVFPVYRTRIDTYRDGRNAVNEAVLLNLGPASAQVPSCFRESSISVSFAPPACAPVPAVEVSGGWRIAAFGLNAPCRSCRDLSLSFGP